MSYLIKGLFRLGRPQLRSVLGTSMTFVSKNDKPSGYTLGQIVDAARRNQRIDPQGAPAHFTFFFDKEIKDESEWLNENAVLELFSYAHENWGVNLHIVGGGVGCFRLQCRADNVGQVAIMLYSEEFRALAKKAGVDKFWFESPHIVIDTSLEQDKAPPAVDFAILTPLLSEFKAVQRSLNEVSLGPALEYPDGAFTFFKYEVPTLGGKNLRVIATFMTKMGNDVAALATFNLLEKWRQNTCC